MLLDARRLESMAPDARPAPTTATRVHETLLHLVTGDRTLREVGRLLLDAYPAVFRDEEGAQRFAAQHLDAINHDERLRGPLTVLDAPTSEH
jgi:hypothetical protein